jgi:DNA processing protein
VAIVGTRSASVTGKRAATEFGLQLAEKGVSVVSGLARGIDGAAHRGALAAKAAPPIGVVAGGLDVVYPREHRDLWEAVASRGVLLSQKPPGTPPHAGSFPERNRILAGVSEAVVVVESRHSGGSLITAHEAHRRDITVLAVPGSVGSRSSEGTNVLLRDGGASMVLDAVDILMAVGLDSRRSQRRRFDPRPRPTADERALLDLLGGDAVGLDDITLRSGRPLGEVAVDLGRLEAAGWVTRSNGWFVALGAPVVADDPGMTDTVSR